MSLDDLPDPDEIPEYDEDDPDGDRRSYLDDPEHRNIEDIPDEELG